VANAKITTKSGNVIEVAFEDILHWLVKAENIVLKSPTEIAAVTAILQAVGKVINDASLDVANPTGLINIPMDVAQLADVKAVWADISALFKL
jgi:hypothetical protein